MQNSYYIQRIIWISLLISFSYNNATTGKNNQTIDNHSSLEHIFKSEQAHIQFSDCKVEFVSNDYHGLSPLLDKKDKQFLQETFNGYFTYFSESVKNKKKLLITSSALGIYSYLWYRLLKTRWILFNSNSLCNWHSEISFEELIHIPQKQLALELLTTIQHRYQTAKNLTDFLSPLMEFLQEINQELDQLTFCISYYRNLQKVYLSLLFPYQCSLIETAESAHQRLSYLKNLFLAWVTEYKMTTHTSSSSCTPISLPS